MTENKEEKLIEEIKTNIESIGINNLDNLQELNHLKKVIVYQIFIIKQLKK